MILYTDHDEKCCAWLRQLVTDGHLHPGDVLCSSITEIKPDDLRPYTQVHHFCGIGGWPLALQLAGWPADRPVWSGSCPCQPFSAAGKRKGQDDERHLWPAMHRLIRECRPPIVLGEQVESAIRLGWLDGVFADLETESYACGAIVLGAHTVGAPHQRQRLFWVANAQHSDGRPGDEGEQGSPGIGRRGSSNGGGISDGRLADTASRGQPEQRGANQPGSSGHADGGCPFCGYATNPAAGRYGCPNCEADGLGITPGIGLEGLQQARPAPGTAQQACAAGCWDNFIIIPCGDGKARRLEPGLAPLVDGFPGRVDLIRGYGNAIVPQTAQAFIEEVMEVLR